MASTIARIKNGNRLSFARVAPVLCIEMLAQILQRRDVELFDVGDMWDAAFGVSHALGDLSAQADDLDLLDAVVARATGARTSFRSARCDARVEIFLHAAPARA
jgi:hypothetical protein